MISFLVAVAENGVMGKNNKLPWHIPEDLKYFKKVTMGHPIIMGRKTYDSIGRPLPGRENIILTANKNLEIDGCKVFYNIEDLLQYCQIRNQEEYFVIGGAEIFRLFLPYVDRLYITKIKQKVEGDVYFPDIDWDKFSLTSEVEGKDEQSPYKYSFQVFDRKQ